MTEPLRPVVIVGPTASGKSALALELAELTGDADLVSVDSMQVYRRMDIGTAKPSPAERQRVHHHLIDLLEPSEECSVGWFQREATAAVDAVRAAGRRPVFVGGTGLYHRAVLDGLSIPGDHPEIRSALEAELAGGAAAEDLHRRLAGLDEAAAARIEPTNARRIVRALEVTLGEGRPFSSFGEGLTDYPPTDHLMVGLRVPRNTIGPLVTARVEQMMQMGLLEEVRRLHAEPQPMSRTAAQALGYRELFAHLRGEWSLADAVTAIGVRTRQFAVRQERWFRRDPRIEWFDVSGGDATESRSLAARIAGTLETS